MTEVIDDYLKWRSIVKEILKDPRMQELKRKNLGFYYRVQDEFLRKIAPIGKCDFEMLANYAKDINRIISEFLPQSSGWKY